MLRARRRWPPCAWAVRNSPARDSLSSWRPPQTEPRRGRSTDGAARGHRDSRGPGTQQNLPQAILSAVLGGRSIDPAQAARRMYASRQFEARMVESFGGKRVSCGYSDNVDCPTKKPYEGRQVRWL